MKRFRFRLDPVLRLRRAAEQEALGALGQAIRSREAAAQLVETCAADESAARAALGGAQRPGGLDIAAILAHQRHAAGTARRLAAARAALRERDVELEAARAGWLAAARDRKALERLREVREAGWTAEGLKEEQQAIDEAAPRAAGGLL